MQQLVSCQKIGVPEIEEYKTDLNNYQTRHYFANGTILESCC